jgi:hypothetical protein
MTVIHQNCYEIMHTAGVGVSRTSKKTTEGSVELESSVCFTRIECGLLCAAALAYSDDIDSMESTARVIRELVDKYEDFDTKFDEVLNASYSELLVSRPFTGKSTCSKHSRI